MTWGLSYLFGGLITAFFTGMYFGVDDGDWCEYNENPGRFFMPIGLGLIWPITAVTILPHYFGIKFKKRRERKAAEAKIAAQKKEEAESSRLVLMKEALYGKTM
jgi:hypothetical protein